MLIYKCSGWGLHDATLPGEGRPLPIEGGPLLLGPDLVSLLCVLGFDSRVFRDVVLQWSWTSNTQGVLWAGQEESSHYQCFCLYLVPR